MARVSKLSAFLIFFASTSASAASAPTLRSESLKRVFCEHYLDPKSDLIEEPLNSTLYAENYEFSYFNNASSLALLDLGIDPFMKLEEAQQTRIVLEENLREGLFPMRVRLIRKIVHFDTDAGKFGLPDRNPSVWQLLRIPNEDKKLTYSQLLSLYPLENERFNNDKLFVGFTTDFNKEGIRKYISFNGKQDVEIGLDVPCIRAREFIDFSSLGSVARVIALGGRVCRVPVMTFSRAPLE